MDSQTKFKKVIVKRQYSRKGCLGCKKRKIKCDELRPSCSTCFKAKKECLYLKPKPKANQKRIPNIQLDSVEDLCSSQSPTRISGSDTYGAKDLSVPRDIILDELLLFENVFDDANTLVNGLLDFENFTYDINAPYVERLATPGRDLKPFHSDIILNDNPKTEIFSNNDELESYLKGTDILNNPELAKSWYQFDLSMRDQVQLESKEESSNVQLTRRIVQIHGLTPVEVEYFETTAIGNFVLYIFPFATNVEDNEVMKVLLEYLMVFKYLVYALMSVNASCVFTSTRNPIHDQQQRKFTAICMRLLVAAFADLKNDEFSLWHIEGLILTVLTLTMLYSEMSFVDTTKAPVSWVMHLQEARALLIKYNSIKAQSQHHKPDSPGITLAKQFFYCYDWSSKMSMPVSEIRTKDLDDLLILIENAEFLTDDPSHIRALTRMGMMIPATNSHTDFHTFTTINSVILRIMYKLIEVISKMNERRGETDKRQAPPQDISNIMSLIDEAINQKLVPEIKAEDSYQIQTTSPAHPSYSDRSTKLYLPDCAYGCDNDGVNSVYYSWCDVALSLHARFLYLKVLTSPGLLYLPRSHPMIKCLIDELILTMFFVKLKKDRSYSSHEILEETDNYYLPKCLFDYRAIMIQLPFRLIIDLTDKESDFEKLELFFKGLLHLGCGSCSLAIERIREKRMKSKIQKSTSDLLESDLNYETAIYPIY